MQDCYETNVFGALVLAEDHYHQHVRGLAARMDKATKE